MTAIIAAITAKLEWEKKIKDEKIVTKWREEFTGQGVAERTLDLVLQLLTKSAQPKKGPKDYYEEDEFPWHLQIGESPSAIWKEPCRNCKCMICQGEEYLANQLDDYEEESEDYRDVQNRLKKYKKIKCKCTDYNTKYTLQYLRENIHHKMYLIDKSLKTRFIAHVKDFDARKGGKDYHPGSNNQMNDIIHPSLFCYVKGTSPLTEVLVGTKNTTDELVAKSDLFQWLPAEFSVIRDKETDEPTRTEIRSYINNLDRNENNGLLYEDIAEIFTKMVPGFEKILQKCNADEKIKVLKEGHVENAPEGDSIKLGDCQVIVKIANAEVNTEHPVFNEGSWHMEGIEAEKIIATGIYYYDQTNIENTYLRFRTTLGGDTFDLDYPQSCFEYVNYHYGFKLASDGAEAAISLGKIPTKENLCLFFPNFLQHKVSKVELKEGCTEGNRGILVFFLINPFEKVISTANVPPQQTTMTLEDAKTYRELSMFERKFEYSGQNDFHQREFSLCEH
jgi:hypothetical protein